MNSSVYMFFVTAEISSQVCGSDKSLGNWRIFFKPQRWSRNEQLGQKQIEMVRYSTA